MSNENYVPSCTFCFFRWCIIQKHGLHDVGSQDKLQYVLIVQTVEGEVAGSGSLCVEAREGHGDSHQIVEQVDIYDTQGVVSLLQTVTQQT